MQSKKQQLNDQQKELIDIAELLDKREAGLDKRELGLNDLASNLKNREVRLTDDINTYIAAQKYVRQRNT